MIGEPLLTLENATVSFGAQPILDGASITVHEGDRIGLIGKNGQGKSTLLAAIMESLPLDRGRLACKRGLRVAILRQRCAIPDDETVAGALDAAIDEVHALREQYEKALANLSDETTAFDEDLDWLHHQTDIAGAWEVDQEKARIATALNLPGANRTIGTLSGGEKRRVDIAATMLLKPDLLLLDEPTNHIDIESVEWIEQFLAQYAGSCVVVTHDRYFLERIANRIAELENGKLLTVRGNYQEFLAHKAVLQDTAERTQTNRNAYLRRELDWLRRAPKARGTKQKARIARFHEWAEAEPVYDERNPMLLTPPPPRLGKRILEADDIAKGYDGRTLFKDFSIILSRGMRIGIVGPNGCGKSTLLNVLTGRIPPDEGRLFIGDHVRFVQVDQQHADVDPESTVLEFVTDGQREIVVDDQKIYVPAFLERFLFDQSVVNMKMKYLSGGEHNRLDLCRKFMRGGNILILDEPTNDLDLPTLRVLEEAVVSFDGCAFIVSHDRYFLNRVCTHLVVFEGLDTPVVIDGGYEDYQLFRERNPLPQLGSAVESPKPSKSERKPTKKGLTYHEKRELAEMEQAIEEAESRLRDREMAVNAEDYYNQNHTVVQEGLDALEAARREVEKLYDRWNELETIANEGRST